MEGIEKLRRYLEGTEEAKKIGSKEEYERIERMHVLMTTLLEDIEEEDRNDKIKCAEVDKWADKVIKEGTRYIKESKNSADRVKIAGKVKEAYQVRGRRSFEHFLIAIEWNFNKDMKFYDIRKNVLKDWVEELQKLEDGEYKGLSISAPPRTGKALSLDSKILTPTGWKKMREIEEGEYVIGADGKKAEVIGVFPQGITDMYRVWFDDNTSVKCSGDHKWTVRINGKESTVIKTTDMIEEIETKSEKNKYSIDNVEPVEFENRLDSEDIEPYALGNLIRKSCLMSSDRVKYNEKIEEYGIKSKEFKDKFIPKKYLYSKIEDREKLLRGILGENEDCNSEGSISYRRCKKRCKCQGKKECNCANAKKHANVKKSEIITISKQLAEDIAELVRGLGGIAVIENKEIEYRILIKIPADKDNKLKKYITRIEKMPDEESQCIYVNNLSHLFVTDGYNLTHNTGLRNNIFYVVWIKTSRQKLFFCKSYCIYGYKSIQ